jgi:hypothetical protein
MPGPFIVFGMVAPCLRRPFQRQAQKLDLSLNPVRKKQEIAGTAKAEQLFAGTALHASA